MTDASAAGFGPFASNMSGLSWELGTGGAPDTLWAVRNGSSGAPNTRTGDGLFALQKSGSTWVPAAGWEQGKALHFTDGTGDVDSEGVVKTSSGVFVASERNNSNNSVSRPSVLKYDPNSGATDLTATIEWNLTAALPAVGANLGLEGITFVPDTFLTAKGFTTDAGTVYDPAAFANHGTGLFFVGLEGTGNVYAFALDQTDGTKFTLLATITTGFPKGVMEVQYDAEKGAVWAICDDTCGGKFATYGIGADGRFARTAIYDRPAGLPNSNNEGFTVAPQALCVNGVKPVVWADDNGINGVALREGTITCTPSTTPVDPNTQQLKVVVPEAAGDFVWSVDGTNGIVSLGTAVVKGDHFEAAGAINPIRVTDTRAASPAWSISAQVGDFTAGGASFSGKYLGWTPKVLEAGGGAAAGAQVASGFVTGNGLAGAATLGNAAVGHAKGSAKLGADLDLKLPVDVTDGTYTATLTLTALG